MATAIHLAYPFTVRINSLRDLAGGLNRGLPIAATAQTHLNLAALKKIE